MKYTIKSASPTGSFDGKFGTLYKFLLVLEDEQGKTEAANINQKSQDAPVGILEGHIEQGKYGPEFKKEAAPFAGNASNGGGSRNDPEVQAAIIRQNALGNAQAVWIARANLMTQAKGLAVLTDENILATANKYANWTGGKTQAPEMVNTAEALGVEDEVQTHPVETPQTVIQAKIASDPRFQPKGEPDYGENPFTE